MGSSRQGSNMQNLAVAAGCRRALGAALLVSSLVALTGCQSMKQPPMETVDQVDLERFMGDWYVIASIPTFIEKAAYNAVESYSLNPDGTVSTVFTFREGDFDGEPKRYTPTGFVRNDESNARWGMQFVWPIKADYRIIYLSDDYGQTVIGRRKRDYVWIMARTPQIPETRYQELVQIVGNHGYDISELRKVPQQPLDEREDQSTISS